jgi:hypothetical protein
MSHPNADPRATDHGTIDRRLLRFLEKLSSGNFFGKVVVAFQNGKVTDVRIEQTKKLDEL